MVQKHQSSYIMDLVVKLLFLVFFFVWFYLCICAKAYLEVSSELCQAINAMLFMRHWSNAAYFITIEINIK